MSLLNHEITLKTNYVFDHSKGERGEGRLKPGRERGGWVIAGEREGGSKLGEERMGGGERGIQELSTSLSRSEKSY